MSEWKPIASAPKDGTAVDLWCEGGRNDMEFYCPSLEATGRVVDGQLVWHGRVPNVAWKNDAWRPVDGLTSYYALSVEPTHWQPLPSPPEGET